MSILAMLREKNSELECRLQEAKNQLESMKNISSRLNDETSKEHEGLQVSSTTVYKNNSTCALGVAMSNISESSIHNVRLLIGQPFVDNNCRVFLRMANSAAITKFATWEPISEMPPNAVGYALILIDDTVYDGEDVTIDAVIKYNIKGDELQELHRTVPSFLLKATELKKKPFEPVCVAPAGNPDCPAKEHDILLALLTVWLTSSNDEVTLKIARGSGSQSDLKQIMKRKLYFEKAAPCGFLPNWLIHRGTKKPHLEGIMVSAARRAKKSAIYYDIHVSSKSRLQTEELVDALLGELPNSKICITPPKDDRKHGMDTFIRDEGFEEIVKGIQEHLNGCK